MLRRLTFVVFAFTAACADRGCAADPAAGSPEPPTVEKTPSRAEASTAWRYIAVKEDPRGPCVDVDGFSVRHLFETEDNRLRAVADPLRRFCLYEGGQRRLGVDRVPAELLGAGYLAVEPDLAAVYGSAPLAELMGPGASDALDRNIGRLPVFPDVETEPVTVALLDTVPTQTASNLLELNSKVDGHGELLGRIMRRVLCDDKERCVGGLRAQLAMPYRSPRIGRVEEDPIRGGTFGTVAGLAEALNALTNVYPGPEPLVINLSLGWSPAYGGTEDDARQWPLSVQAAYEALVSARCRGALIFAAVGNQTGGSIHHSGPLLPALWSREPAPDAALCAEFGVKGGARLEEEEGAEQTAPALLYAVGAVDGRGADIANARELSQPPLVAHGDQAATKTEKGYTRALTGTSVSTAVVSAIAALVWSHHRSLSPDDIARSLYAFGEDVGMVSATCYAPGCSNTAMRRANACLVLDKVCAQQASSCAGRVSGCGGWKRVAPQTPPGLLNLFGASAVNAPQFSLTAKSDPACGALELYPSKGTNLCPSRQFYTPAAKPWTHPQPGSSPCPNCRAASTLNAIVLESPLLLDTASVLSLQIKGPASTQSYDLSGIQWPGGMNEATLMVQPGLLSSAESVTLSMDDGRSHSIVPIPIVD